ncbi:MAG TPA: inositol monophosphatase family protein [Solirubrobacteraceae bacterium]|jgi:myo-inositol-1(or 4)-monophosphatase|nr:inositol monophosphatase family protein [Solirubrobacteraceae bacterium]
MDTVSSAIEADWLGACRRASRRLTEMLAATSGIAERAQETGSRGSGGDRTLVIDETAESIVLEELERLHAEGHRFSAISEERGEIDFGDPAVRVVIDPIDGSLNAKRGLPHHAVSVAVASGNTMADVEFGFVFDFGPQEEWSARRGEGAWLNGERLDPELQERRGRDGRLEVLGIESADPRWVKASIDELGAVAYRLRALGAIAPALCQVAASRLDGLVSLHNCRAVDAAAGQLIVREAGGAVSFPRCSAPLSAPLDAEPRSPVVAARSPETLRELERVPDLQ